MGKWMWWYQSLVTAWEDFMVLGEHGDRVFLINSYRCTLGIPSIWD
jgi:hypothetical protein